MSPFWMILTMALVTLFTRAFPFLLFPGGKPIPPLILYLGRVLPYAMIAMLVVYCFRLVSFTVFPYGAYEFLAAAAVVGLHLWKGSSLLSIGGGTAVYLLLLYAL